MFRPYNNQLNSLIQKKNIHFSYIDSLLNTEKLPYSFGFIPLVLSGYLSETSDHLYGRGIWSLSYISAVKNGLIVNSYIDQRLNNKLSTKAAIAYLKTLWDKYKSEKWTILSFITSPTYVSNIIRMAQSNKWEQTKSLIQDKYLYNALYFVITMVFVQIILGIFTLLSGLNIYLASLHQISTTLLIISSINFCFSIKKE